ncbi:hypothetical protein SDC9_172389 [bioreactor metagenome]|uniref:Uncharacterized protein n=1 Tax=bioreactor metagenome TaxID=1076179 RepID=A0A645GG05_9ZZZZ
MVRVQLGQLGRLLLQRRPADQAAGQLAGQVHREDGGFVPVTMVLTELTAGRLRARVGLGARIDHHQGPLFDEVSR